RGRSAPRQGRQNEGDEIEKATDRLPIGAAQPSIASEPSAHDVVGPLSDYVLEVVRKDEEFSLYRGSHRGRTEVPSVLLLAPVSSRPALETIRRIEHEYSLRDALSSAWAVRSLALSQDLGPPTLVLEDPGGETLDRLVRGPMEMTLFLRIATGLAAALGSLHESGLIHKDVKPAHVLVN